MFSYYLDKYIKYGTLNHPNEFTESIIAISGFSREKRQEYYKSKLLNTNKHLYAAK
jgi:hypothetical protein